MRGRGGSSAYLHEIFTRLVFGQVCVRAAAGRARACRCALARRLKQDFKCFCRCTTPASIIIDDDGIRRAAAHRVGRRPLGSYRRRVNVSATVRIPSRTMLNINNIIGQGPDLHHVCSSRPAVHSGRQTRLQHVWRRLNQWQVIISKAVPSPSRRRRHYW